MMMSLKHLRMPDATREYFNKFADSEEYKRFLEKRQKEDEQQKSKFLSERKESLGSPDQDFVFLS